MANSSHAEDLVRRMAAVALMVIPRKLQRKKRSKEKVVEAEEKTGFVNHHTSSVPSSSSAPPAVLLGLQRVIEEMNFIKEKVSKLQEGTGFIIQSSMLAPSSSSSSAPPPNAKTTTMVGFDGYVEQILDQLTGYHSGRQILPIVGMGGIGKTTLATNVYRNSLMLHHFDILVWITVSQEFSARNIILQALSCLGESISNTETSESDDELGEKLYRVLLGRRYLIVLDDIWSVEAWEKIKFFFPENNNRSRIVVTTRELELVDYFGFSAVAVDFLDKKHSWELFCEKTFAQQGCPHPELENVGKNIVKKCKGLPLTISVIGGLLGKSSKTREYWEKIAEDKSLILDSGEGNTDPLSILYLSYKHLPVWLKSCFLYLGLFPEDHQIEISQLIKLWVAEGFIKAKSGKSLEEVAESYVRELVVRNLLIVGELRTNKKLKSCKVHDVIRELCVRIGEKEKYFCVHRDIDGMRHFIVDEPTARLFYPQESQKTTPSIVSPVILERQRAAPVKSRLLRVSFVCDTSHIDFLEQVNLRFLFSNMWLDYGLHSPIHLLWSLQTLIVHSNIEYSFHVPCEIWKMPQLRHMDLLSIYLPDPPSPTCEDDVIVLQNLQTLQRVHNLVLSEEVCKRIPNIKELGISYTLLNKKPWGNWPWYHLQNLGCFNKLESLQLYDAHSHSNLWEYLGGNSSQKLELPSSLKELSLFGWELSWSDMAMIASLPYLHFLKFGGNSVVTPMWDCVEGEFLSLKHLQVHGCDNLFNWSTADSSSFPELETLSLEDLYELEEIPLGIGEIPTLERIHIYKCSESAVISAMKILEEQESLGNQSLQLQLKFFFKNEAAMWRVKIEEMGITCQNLHIDGKR
ncbi:hypothetical protein C2S51_006610 [Perilla frutescens var. frutescens]|nr:hypothetical protein C2S51_006610 [Perilla frutescens var. frutescens]